MESVQEKISQQFGHKLRVRVSGICIENNSILLVKHVGVGKKPFLWAPPGGGLSFEETVDECLKREFLEETGLEVQRKEFICVNEYFERSLHAIELFFLVERVSGKLITGIDPEMDLVNQIIREVRFVPFPDIQPNKTEEFHSLFTTYKNEADFFKKADFIQNIVSG